MKNITFIIFGGTGDLAKRKLAPALAKLLDLKRISSDSNIIGIGRSDFNDKLYKEELLKFSSDSQKKIIRKLKISYFRGDVSKGLNGLEKLLNKLEKGKSCDRIFYLSTSFNLFGKITKELDRLGLNCVKNGCSTKVVFEKPFGRDLRSNDSFEKEIHKVFKESQIFRIDHYVGKETISNLNTLKFENPVFESVLNKNQVDRIEVIVDENLKVGKRIFFYNDFGALKDMVQSHLLQVLSLLLMNRPKSFNAEDIHKEKTKALKSLTLQKYNTHLLGQYVGYSEELDKYGLRDNGVDTFVKIKLKSNLKRWKGVDISLRTGKALKNKFGKIIVTFKHKSDMGCLPNQLEINIQPIQDINLLVNISKNGVCERIKMEFCHACRFGPNSSDGYEIMLNDVIKGDHTLFTTVEENRASWKIIGDFEKIRKKVKFIKYNVGTDPELNN